MVGRVLVIGGYGNFGSYISKRLAAEPDIQLIIGGRSGDKAREFTEALSGVPNPPEWRQFDLRVGFPDVLTSTRPDIVIHTSGPFQDQGYEVASHCIDAGCHYIDLADARDFVAHIGALHQAAEMRGVLVLSGASSVPCLTGALIDKHIGEFECLEKVIYGIATAQQTNRGLATTSAVLSYAGKPFTTLIDGTMRVVYGWQDLHFKNLPKVGRRSFANCDIPDLTLFPKRYPSLKTIRFFAGLEVPIVHLGLWLFTWLVRSGVISSLERLAPMLLKVSRLFDAMGSDVSAFYMELSGRSRVGSEKTISFNLTAASGDGPFIPCAPAIIMAKRLVRQECTTVGAFPCIGFVDLASYLDELADLAISWEEKATESGYGLPSN
jgi:saccharopine dehydrogenase-like NADP-dependent oxidoreductase